MMINDLSCEKFEPELYIKNWDDRGTIINTMKTQFQIFDAFYKVLLAKSNKLGRVSYEAIMANILDAQTTK